MMSSAIYRSLPLPAQNGVCSLLGWWQAFRRADRGSRRACGRAFDAQQTTPSHLAAVRDARLKEFVAEAVRTVPFYSRMFTDLKLSPADVTRLEDMRHLPIITAETVAACSKDFVSSTACRADFMRRRHLGSAGLLALPWSEAAQREREAIQARFERTHGITAGTWCAYFGGTNVVPVSQLRPPYWRINWAGRRVIFSPYHLSEQTVESYADALNHFQCPWMQGSPAVLASLAGLMSAARLTIDYPLSWITTDGERLLGIQRRALSRVFGISPKRSFIDVHGTACITERRDGTLAIDEGYAAVELLPADDRGTYRVIGTNLTNSAAPLLRFDTGVTVRLAPQSAAEPELRRVASVEGLSQDLVTLPSGARIGRLERMFDDLPQVRAARILQHADLTIDVDVLMTPGHSSEDDREVAERVAARFGTAMFRVHCLDRMPAVARGKLQTIHSEVQGVNRGVVEPPARWVSIE